jgi:hypothetical protein
MAQQQQRAAGDAALVPLFRNLAVPNRGKSAAEGRPIFDDMVVVDIRYPGSPNYGTYPAAQMSHWIDDPYTGEQRALSYAERFPRQYQQFLEHAEQTKSGTPLDFAGFLTEGKRSELRAQNIYTIEVLAAIEGTELKNLGPGGRDYKNKAQEYLDNSKSNIPNTQLQAEMEAMRARQQILEEDNAVMKQRLTVVSTAEARFEDMTLEQLREFIRTNTGHAPTGLLNKKALVKLALEVPAAKAMA